MEGYKLIIYIFFISLIQISSNSFFNFLKEKNNLKKNDNNILNSTNFTINTLCFMYNLYFLLIFLKTYLLPEIIDIFFTAQSML